MPQRALTVLAALGALALHAAPALLAAEAPRPAAAGYHRIELPAIAGKACPYTVEVPTGWQVLQAKDSSGIWLGPAGAQPSDDPQLVYVRVSPVSLANPEAVVAAIRANDAKDDTWSAPLVEVREVGGVKGVLVQMDTGTGDKARSALTLKMPLEKASVDFIGSARREEFGGLRPAYERVFLSVRPAPAGKP
jgi:hypothetical protein